MSMAGQLRVLADPAALAAEAAGLIAAEAAAAIADRGRFTLALSGGTTPRATYERLAAAPFCTAIDWARVQIFYGDERCVPPDDPRSNHAMARAALLDHVPLPAANIHRMRGEDPPEQAAIAYTAALQACFGGDPDTGPPAEGFDLVLLGLGGNGHTASLFPGLPAVTERRRWVMAQYVEVAGMWRLTLTPVVLNAARRVVFLVAGRDKAAVLRRVLCGPPEPLVLPAQAISPASGGLLWLADRAAAAQMSLP